MKIADLNELFLHELKDVYDAEHQLLKALPKMAKAATAPELKKAFENHLLETEQHVARLESVFEACGETPDRETCAGMKGLVAEGEKLMKEDIEPDALDAALIGAAQRVEHYEMAAYGTLISWAGTAGVEGAAELLEATLDEEKAADRKLTTIAESTVNVEAETEGEEEDEEGEEPASGRVRSQGAGRSAKSRTRTRRSSRSKARTR